MEPLNPKLSHDFEHNRDRALKTILPAVDTELGNLAGIARRLSIGVDTVRRWRNKEPRMRKAIDAARIRAIKEAP